MNIEIRTIVYWDDDHNDTLPDWTDFELGIKWNGVEVQPCLPEKVQEFLVSLRSDLKDIIEEKMKARVRSFCYHEAGTDREWVFVEFRS